jgi:hypothetical protein
MGRPQKSANGVVAGKQTARGKNAPPIRKKGKRLSASID